MKTDTCCLRSEADYLPGISCHTFISLSPLPCDYKIVYLQFFGNLIQSISQICRNLSLPYHNISFFPQYLLSLFRILATFEAFEVVTFFFHLIFSLPSASSDHQTRPLFNHPVFRMSSYGPIAFDHSVKNFVCRDFFSSSYLSEAVELPSF